MRILVIGGTHFIGLAAVEQLCAQGHEVAVFHRGTSNPEDLPQVEQIHGDRETLGEHLPAFKRFSPDVVLDTCASFEHQARLLVDVFRGLAGRAVVLSSVDVYRAYGRLHESEPGPLEPTPLTEDAPLRESLYPYRDTPGVPTDYGAKYDKIPIERIVLSDPTLPGTVLRLPFVYGPRDYQHRLGVYLRLMDDGRPAILLDRTMARWRGTHGYVENVAAAITRAVTDQRAAGRLYNVGEADAPEERAWVEAIGRAAGWDGRVAVVEGSALPLALRWWGDAAMEQDLVTDTRRIRTELGIEDVVALDEGLRRSVAWERDHRQENLDAGLLDYAAQDAVLAGL